MKTCRLLFLAGLAFLATTASAADPLLIPADLHPLAHWGGSERDGFLQPAHVAPIHDGDTGTKWDRTSGSGHAVHATPMLTSPRPFIVTSVEVVASGALSEGAIEILAVGSAEFITTGLSVPNTLNDGDVWTMAMPVAHQVPISAIRHNSPGAVWNPEMYELRFYGTPIEINGGEIIDITSDGSVQTNPGSESPAGSLTNGIMEDTTDGYDGGAGGAKSITIDFGAGVRKQVLYTAWNPNIDLGSGTISWTASGTTGVGCSHPLSFALISPVECL